MTVVVKDLVHRTPGNIPSTEQEVPQQRAQGTISLAAMAPNAGVFPADDVGSPATTTPQKAVSAVHPTNAVAQRQELQRQRHRELAASKDSGATAYNPLDLVQAGLGVVGLFDVAFPIAMGADSLDTAISLARGDTKGAMLGATSVATGYGLVAGGAKVSYHWGRFVSGVGNRISDEALALGKRIGRDVTEICGRYTTRFPNDITVSGGKLAVGSRGVNVKYADGTTGKVEELFAFKVEAGSKFPMNADSSVQTQLDRIAAEVRKQHPDTTISVRPFDSSSIPVHPSGAGRTERGWLG